MTDNGASSATWDLEPLVFGKGEQGVDDLLAEAAGRADGLAAKKGTLASFSPDDLAAFMRELAEIKDLIERAAYYSALRYSADTTVPQYGALMQSVQERSTSIETRLLFFELEWAQLDDDEVSAMLDSDALDPYRHYLISERRYRDHLLSEPEERIMSEKSVSGVNAWVRLFSELTSMLEVELDGENQPFEEAMSRLVTPDRDVRKRTAEAITAALEPGLRTRAYLFNTVVYDKAVDDRLRSYDHWLQGRNLSNEASDESVAALVEAVRKRYDIPQRWYRLKASILGIDRLADYDRIASVVDEDETISWEPAKEIVLESYASFSAEMADLAARFFDERWIDAPVRPGKRPGAFCAYTVPSHHPYVFLNFTHRRNDVLTMAHELGHGLHAALARPQGIFHQSTPLTLAETASVFGETVTTGRLLELSDSPKSRFSLLAGSVERAIATVFRQIAMNRFEDAVHNSRRAEGELSVERFGELWFESQTEMVADSVELTDGYRSWWSYIPHFIGTPGYVYAYAYGQLLALAVYKRYEEDGPSFVPRYLEMLSAGGSMAPEELGRLVDCDLTDPGFWVGGLDIVESQLQAAEAAARDAGMLAASNVSS
ncbi:MAG: M3 family oligoendopeptidase [Actinomycetota bacterium]